MIIFGIDPDSDKHGVARYDNGELVGLYSLRLIEMYEFFEAILSSGMDCVVHIEDVRENNAVFIKRKNSYSGKDLAEVKARSRTLGMVQHSQIEVERLCEYFEIKVVKHKISKKWKDAKGKKQFEQITGWAGRSNKDTRSAAYFGWLGFK